MALGVNAGKQLNVFIFETLLINPKGGRKGEGSARSIAIHPMFVVPSSIQTVDNTRNTVQRTMGGSLRVLGGRDLLRYSFAGNFGVENRGFGPIGGDGETRRRRFEKEVVRLSSATRQEDVQDALNYFGTDLANELIDLRPISQALSYANMKRSYFAVNLYDFWNRRFMQVEISSFGQTRSHRNAGASGLVSYTLSVQEVGPLISASGSPEKLLDLLEVTATANDMLSLLDDATLTAAIDTAALLVAVPLNFSALTPVANGAAAALRLLGPGGGLTRQRLSTAAAQLAEDVRVNIAALFPSVVNAVIEIRDALDTLRSEAPTTLQPVRGWVPFETLALTDNEPWLANFETAAQLEAVQDGLMFQEVAGCFYGMGRQDYKAFVESGGELGKPAPDITATIEHSVAETDTGKALALRYGVEWADILKINAMTPDEALYPGTTLLIPVQRARGGMGVDGLEVFGSHSGTSVYGSDLAVEMSADSDGDLVTVAGVDCLEQGMLMLGERFASMVTDGATSVPTVVRDEFVAQRLRVLLQRDKRVAAVTRITRTNGSGTGLGLHADVVAIGGATATLEV